MTDQEIKVWLEQTLQSIPISYSEIEIETPTEDVTIFAITSDESGILIGNNGETLLALNHLLRRAAENKTKMPMDKAKNISIDVNNYRKKSDERLKGVASMLGERALGLKYEVVMEPMGSYERRIVHSFFQNHPNLTTESRGFGRDRHIIIKYTEFKTPQTAEGTEKEDSF